MGAWSAHNLSLCPGCGHWHTNGPNVRRSSPALDRFATSPEMDRLWLCALCWLGDDEGAFNRAVDKWRDWYRAFFGEAEYRRRIAEASGGK